MEAYQRLEEQWARWNGLDPAGMVACSSGTAALHLALESLQLPPTSKVILSDFNMIACARAVTLAGLTPVFVDCGDDLLIGMDLACKVCYENEPKALMLVHVYGRQCDKYSCETVKSRFEILVIEDLAEAHGIRPHPQTDAACWSFYKNKIVAGEEGGAVWFKNPTHAGLARELRSLGFTKAHDFRHMPRGHNYRMSNAHAYLVLDSLAVATENMRERRAIESMYEAQCPNEWRMPPRDQVWVYDLRIPGMGVKQQGKLILALNEAGVAARHAFWPMHRQLEYKDCKVVMPKGKESNALRLAQEVIYLSVVPGKTDASVAKLSFEVIKRTVG